MKTKKIFIFSGNPDKETLSTAFVETYAEGARASGHEVRVSYISDMKFDPVLHKGYKTIQEYEPDLVKFQDDVRWADHFVSIYPIWWSDMPALMKGLVDRVWMPGFAFNFRKGIIPGWIRRLRGKSARIIVTSDSHPLILLALFGGNINNWVRGVLKFSGFSPVRITWFSGMRNIKPEKIQCMLKKVNTLGRRGC